MTLLAIETSCDETSAAVIVDGIIMSNIVWSQVKLHKKWGGVVPSIAKRAHEDKINGIIEEALKEAGIERSDYVAVAVGPGLAIALEVGILKAKELCNRWDVPLIAVNHLEGHIFASVPDNIWVPGLALVVSGGHTELVFTDKTGKYVVVAKTSDDALGEALDKASKILGLGYPGGPEIEKQALLGDRLSYQLPMPMKGREKEGRFSYSGLKTAFLRLVENEKIRGSLTKKKVQNLAASYQEACFEHLIRVVRVCSDIYLDKGVKKLLVGGGVILNARLREKLDELGDDLGISVEYPRERILCGDNAGMIGLSGYHKALRGEVVKKNDFNAVERLPRWSLDNPSYKTVD